MRSNYERGDFVYLDCNSSFGSQSTGEHTIDDIRTRYDEETGVKYDQYYVHYDWYDSRDGHAITGPAAFYIRDIK